MSPVQMIKTSGGKSNNYQAVVTRKGDKLYLDVDGNQFVIDVEDYDGKVIEGTALVRMSEDNSKLWGIYPCNATVFAKFTGLVAQADQPLTPKFIQGGPRKTKEGKSFTAKDKFVFSLGFEITKGRFNGVKLSFPLDYLFERYGETGVSVPLSTRKGSHSQILVTTLELLGFDWAVDDLVWSDNLLPQIDKILKSKPPREYMLAINGQGYIDTISLPPEE